MAPSLPSSDASTHTAPIRLVLVDDSAELRALIRMRFRLEAGVEVVAEAGSGENGRAAVSEHQPDVVITDVCMPGMDGIELASALRCEYPEVAVVVMTGLPDADVETRALAAGATAFVEKAPQIDVLVDLVRGLPRRRPARLEAPRG